MIRKIALICTTLAIIVLTSCGAAGKIEGVHLDKIQMPPGFNIQVYAAGLPGARSMVLSPGGVLFVGTRRMDKVYAVVDRDADQKSDACYVINLDPHVAALGMKFYTGRMFPPPYRHQIFIAEHGS